MNILELLFIVALIADAHLYMAQPTSRQFWQAAAFQTIPTGVPIATTFGAFPPSRREAVVDPGHTFNFTKKAG